MNKTIIVYKLYKITISKKIIHNENFRMQNM